MNLEEKRNRRTLEKKKSNDLVLIGSVTFLTLIIGLVFILGNNSTKKPNRTICECAEIYKKELLGYSRGFISDCANHSVYRDRVASYATQQGWFPAQGDGKLISLAGDFFIYECN